MSSVTGVGVFEDLMSDPHLKDLVGQSSTMMQQQQQKEANKLKVKELQEKALQLQKQSTLSVKTKNAASSSSSPSSASYANQNTKAFDAKPYVATIPATSNGAAPLDMAKQALTSIQVHMNQLKAAVSSSEQMESVAQAKLQEQHTQLKSIKEESLRGEKVVKDLEFALSKAREELASVKTRQRYCMRTIERTEEELKEAQREGGRAVSQYNAVIKAQKHLEESFQYLETLDDMPGSQSKPTMVHSPVHNPLSQVQPGSGDWPWDQMPEKRGGQGVPGSKPSVETELSQSKPSQQQQGTSSMSLEEKVKKEEEEARMAAVERSRREKEAILKARKEIYERVLKEKKATASPSAPSVVNVKTSELLNTEKQERSSSRPDQSAASSSSQSAFTAMQKEERRTAPISSTPPTPAAASSTPIQSTEKQQKPSADQSSSGETVTRDDVRNEFEEKLHPFMPNIHEFREASRGSVPERSRAAPGGLCNRHCSRNCLKSCTAGFLMAIGIPVKPSASGNVGLNELFDTVNKAMRKFHPDRNSVRRVGLHRSLYCEEVCKDLSLLQSLMDTTNEVTFVLIFGNNDLPKMRVNMSLSATVAQLKKRVVDDYGELDASSLSFRVGGMEMRDPKTLDSCGIKENCIVNVQCSIKGWTSF